MLPVPASVLDAIPDALHVGLGAEITTGGRTHDLGVVDYRITADAGSVSRYTCDLTLDPSTDTRLLRPYGATLACWHVLAPPGVDAVHVPAGVYRLNQRSQREPDDSLTVTAAGGELLISRDSFTAPRTIQSGSTVASIQALILETLPDAVIDVRVSSDKGVPKVTYDKSRWEAIDGADESLARSIGAEVYVDAGGRWVIADGPSITDRPVWAAEEGPGGVLVSLDDEITDSDVVNVWVVTGERTDGTPPVTAVVEDEDPDSPTYADGMSNATGDTYGRQVGFASSPLLDAWAHARNMGRRKLGASVGLPESVSFESVPHPGLEVGDVVETVTATHRSRRVIESLQFSAESMSATTRVIRRVLW